MIKGERLNEIKINNEKKCVECNQETSNPIFKALAFTNIITFIRLNSFLR